MHTDYRYVITDNRYMSRLVGRASEGALIALLLGCLLLQILLPELTEAFGGGVRGDRASHSSLRACGNSSSLLPRVRACHYFFPRAGTASKAATATANSRFSAGYRCPFLWSIRNSSFSATSSSCGRAGRWARDCSTSGSECHCWCSVGLLYSRPEGLRTVLPCSAI